MADKQVSREIFEAIMKEMVGTFRPSRDGVSDDPFRASGPSRSTPKRYDEDFTETERYSRDDYRPRASSYSTPRRQEAIRSPPSYFSDNRRSRSPHRPDDYYFNSRSEGGESEFVHPRDAVWSDERPFRRPARRDDSFDEVEFARPGPKRDYTRPDNHVSRGRLAYLERRQSAGRGQSTARGQRGGVARRGPGRGSAARAPGRESATRGREARGPGRESATRGPVREARGPVRESASRGPVREPRGPVRESEARGPVRESRGPGRESATRGPGRESATRGPGRGFAGRGPMRGAATRGHLRGGVATRGQLRGAIAGRGQRGGRGASQRGQRGASTVRGRGSKTQGQPRKGVLNGKKGPLREDTIGALMAGSDVVSKLGSKVVKWSGFNKVNTGEFDQRNPAFNSVQTQTFANALASFKFALKPELRYQCFLTVKAPNHAALKKPIVDSEFLGMLVAKGIVENKKSFADLINPLDKYLTSFQQCILKSAHPLLLACNAYELNMKQGFAGATDLSTAYENAMAMCRKSLLLFGQTYSIATSLRQEKILEYVGLQEMAPKPSDFPNMEDSALFGKKYMAQLKAWLEKSGYPMHLQTDQQRPPKESQEELAPEPKVKEIMDDLLENALNALKEKKKAEAEDLDEDAAMEDTVNEKPELWFLFDEASQEYKYYQQKLLELHKQKRADKEAKRAQLKAAAAVSMAAKSAGPSKATTDPQFDEVDASTRQTAENLARFILQLGSNIEDFNMDSLTSNPEFWFLTKKESPAHKFYQMKLAEFTESQDGDAETVITEDTDVTCDDTETKGTINANGSDSALQDSQASELSNEAAKVACESTSANTTPTQTALPQRKRGAQKVARTVTPKKAHIAEESKADDPVKTANEKATGRAGLRKKPKLADDEHVSEEAATKGNAASGDEDSVTGSLP
ncbi:SURP and G-patch domain-containing protein 2-like isoform X2 [Ambystoma mexicanum]|uniref:SURP and G-patch domain-containing protein 2-like isoform X2 n=1 Tax=Ambystoma mexicanum TaxID=8296 RepID=UPI0037E91212